MDSRRTLCLYHPQEYITNFCREKSCLMPLCPTCIRDHAQYHVESAIKPQYFNISETVVDVYNLILSSINSLQQDRKRNLQLMKEIQGIGAIVKEKVLSAKKYVYQVLQLSFQELQENLLQAIYRINQDQGLHCMKKTEKVNQKVSDSLNELYALLQGLKTDKTMASLIVFLKDKQPETSALHNSLMSYLDRNEAYETKIEFSNQAKNNIQYNVGRLMKVQVKGQVIKEKDKHGENKSIFKNKGTKKEMSEKTQKLQRTYTPEKTTIYSKSIVEDPKSFNKSLIKNSPYRQRYEQPVKPFQPTNSSSHFNQIYESHKNNVLNSDLQTSPRKFVHTRKQNEAIYMHNA